MFEGEPCTNFVKKKIRVLDEEVFDSREESLSDDSSRAFQRRRWLVDSPKFVKDAAPAIAACLRNTECIADVFHIPTMIPEAKRALFEIWAYSSVNVVNHSIYATDFNDPSLLSGAKCSLKEISLFGHTRFKISRLSLYVHTAVISLRTFIY
jgi:hypothetical protein